MNMNAMIFLVTLAMISCRKEGLPDPPPCNNCNTDTLLVWSRDIDTLSGMEFLFANPVIYNGDPIFGVYRFGDCEYSAADRINCYDAQTGQKKWAINPPDQCSHIENLHVYDNFLLVHLQRELLAYRLTDHQLIWSLPLPENMTGSFGLHGISDKVYLSIGYKGPSAWPEESGLLEVTIPTGQYREICRFKRKDWGGLPVVHPPTLWIDPQNGDSLLMLAVGLYNYIQGPSAARHSVHAYDLTKDSFRWQIDSIGIPTNNYRRVEVYDNKVYIVTDWRIHCFDAFTGTKIWESEMPNNTQQIDFSFSRPFATKGKLIANSTSDEMYCFDANTGHLIWSVLKNTASANQDLIEHNGVVYLSSGGNGRLVGVDLETGQILLSIRSPNGSPSFSGYNVIVNKEKNLLFLNSFRRAYAYTPVR